CVVAVIDLAVILVGVPRYAVLLITFCLMPHDELRRHATCSGAAGRSTTGWRGALWLRQLCLGARSAGDPAVCGHGGADLLAPIARADGRNGRKLHPDRSALDPFIDARLFSFASLRASLLPNTRVYDACSQHSSASGQPQRKSAFPCKGWE